MSQLDRSNALITVAALPVVAVAPSVAITAAVERDPIFQAIEKHRACATIVIVAILGVMNKMLMWVWP